MNTPILDLKNIKKSYQGNAVLKGVSLTVNSGEIHGLIGENGAGKSTLMNILFGMPVIHETGGFEGEVLFDGKAAGITSPKQAMQLGIGMVHQEFMLIPGMTVFENILLDKEPLKTNALTKFLPKKLAPIDTKAMRQQARESLIKVGLTLDETRLVGGLPVGHKQFIEIAREVGNAKVRLLVLDEPTAVLTESEAEVLLKTLKHLAQDLGIGILFISHRLDEVESLCDAVTVLRDGELVGSYKRGQINKDKMAELMVGHKVGLDFVKRPAHTLNPNDIILEFKNVSVDMPGESVHGLDLQIRRGEILGLGGLAGQGKIGIANGLAGLHPTRGEILLNGKPLPLNDAMAVLKNKIAFLSEDRRGVGLLLDESIEHNIAITALNVQGQFLKSKFGIKAIDDNKTRTHADEMIRALDIRCRDATQETRRLSGGNQQKVCLARIITLAPDILLVSEPTRGVDIGAKKLILQKLVDLNAQGMTILLTSSELVELRSICDRIAIVSRGKIANILAPNDSDKDFGLAMAA